MLRQHLLRLGHPVAVAALLEALVAVTNERDDDDRPRPIRLKYLAADGRQLPTWVNSLCGETGLIVSDEPCPEFAEGTLLLWLRLIPVPRRGRVDDEGLYHGQVDVHLWQAPEYPLPPREVDWFVAHHCGARNNTWWHLTRGWQTLCDDTWRVPVDPAELPRPYIVLGKTPAPAPSAALAGSEPEQGPDPVPGPESGPVPETVVRRRKARPGLGTGQPRAPWNKRLMERMSEVPTEELYNFDPFFQGWVEDHLRDGGRLPKYPEDDFKQAAFSCAERIIRMRAARAA